MQVNVLTDLGLRIEHAHLHFVVVPMAVGLTDVYQAGLDAEDQVVEGFGAGNQVEGGREGAALIEVGQPQLGPGKLPLHIGILLRRQADERAGFLCACLRSRK